MQTDRMHLDAVLANFGFSRQGGRKYHADGCRLTIGPRWWLLRRPARPGTDWSTRRDMWKLADAEGLEECCDLPVGELGIEPEDLADLLAWALDDTPAVEAGTDEGSPFLPNIDASRLTARAGTAVCQGLVQATPSQLRVEFQLSTPPADLPSERQAWLAAMCVATHRDRLVRVTVHPETAAVCASVDLTGCPVTHREALLLCAIDHLRAGVERLLPVVKVLNNPSVASRALCSDALSLTAMEKDK